MTDEALEHTLLTQASSFSFFQAMRLLRQISERRGHDPQRAIRVRPVLDMNRPQSSVVRITRVDASAPDALKTGKKGELSVGEGPIYDVETSFLGLYGASSPLPNFYTEDLILAEQEDQSGGRAFLDVFQQRLYDLYLRAQEKHRPLYDLTESADARLLEVLWSLIGLRAPELRAQVPDSHLLLRYLSLFAARQRSAAGLQAMLEDFIGSTVTVNQCVQREFRVPTRYRLSLGEHGHCLGEGSVLGSLAREFSGRIEILIGPLSHSVFNTLMNEGENWSLLISLIRYYLNTPVECNLLLTIGANEAQPLALGDAQWACLGQSSWLYDRDRAQAAPAADILTAKIALV